MPPGRSAAHHRGRSCLANGLAASNFAAMWIQTKHAHGYMGVFLFALKKLPYNWPSRPRGKKIYSMSDHITSFFRKRNNFFVSLRSISTVWALQRTRPGGGGSSSSKHTCAKFSCETMKNPIQKHSKTTQPKGYSKSKRNIISSGFRHRNLHDYISFMFSSLLTVLLIFQVWGTVCGPYFFVGRLLNRDSISNVAKSSDVVLVDRKNESSRIQKDRIQSLITCFQYAKPPKIILWSSHVASLPIKSCMHQSHHPPREMCAFCRSL